MVGALNFRVRNVEHLEEETDILNVVGVVIVVDVEPIHSMSFWVLVTHCSSIVSGWDQNGGRIGSRTLRWHQTKVVVSVHVLLLQLIKVINPIQTKFLQILFDIRGDKVGDEPWFRLAHPVRRNEVVRFSQNLVEAEWKLRGERGSLHW